MEKGLGTMIYVDPLFSWPASLVKEPQAKRLTERNKKWCHMMADSEEELRAFAPRIGLRLAWIQKPGTAKVHFDLTPSRRAAAVRLGAKEITASQMRDVWMAKVAFPSPGQKTEPSITGCSTDLPLM